MVARAERSRITAELFDRLVGCDDPEEQRRLRDEVIVVNRGVAQSVASRYRGRGVDLDDLVQVAYMGLTKAVSRFDVGREYDFLTFAVPTIRGELQRYFRDQGWAVRPTRRVQELQWRMNQSAEGLSQRLGREPSEGELIADLQVEPSEYAEAVQAFGCFQPTSLDRPVGPESAQTIGDLLAGDDDVELRPVLELAPVVRRLSERDRRILYLRYFEDQTQAQIGAELGVTQMQVSRLLSRILNRLREEMTEDDETAAPEPVQLGRRRVG